ncbi:unnamed protein product [Urochloa decumbens]|uniref:F-box/LRR-repeat protein 15/At3g58940/PEG3-like LRR domain-containing protein n=1 Tax=Urochloa decumbens TaxID=240449 RepID=A0ABC9B2Y8_9POAL
MDHESMDVVPAGVHADRLSKLSDGTLGHILSFLPAAEAARAAALCQRWRHVFAAVHTISFKEPKRSVREDDSYYWMDWSPGYGPPVDDTRTKPVPTQPFVNSVGAALHGRHRGSLAVAAPLRGLRIAFDAFAASDAASATAVDGWLSYAAHQAAAAELRVDLRLGRAPICARAYALRRRDDADGADHPLPLDIEVDKEDEEDYLDLHSDPPQVCDYYAVPRSLFACAALRSLRLSGCRLDTPAAIALPSLDTLHLTRVTDRMNAAHVERLVAGCPCLADLTLEACDAVTKLSLLDKHHIRRLALRCCHELATVAIDSSELREFEYGGAVPGPSLLTLHGPRRVVSCTLNFCGEEVTDQEELARLVDFLGLFAGSARLGSGIGHNILSSKLEFPALRNLELTGMLPEDDIATVSAVTRILQRTPSLQTLSLFFLPEPEDRDRECHDEESLRAAHKLRYNQYMTLPIPDCDDIPCLRERMREINLVHYQGSMAQRMLAMLLLRKAPVVNEVYCEFARGPLLIQTKLMEEIKGWALNKSANMMFF